MPFTLYLFEYCTISSATCKLNCESATYVWGGQTWCLRRALCIGACWGCMTVTFEVSLGHRCSSTWAMCFVSTSVTGCYLERVQSRAGGCWNLPLCSIWLCCWAARLSLISLLDSSWPSHWCPSPPVSHHTCPGKRAPKSTHFMLCSFHFDILFLNFQHKVLHLCFHWPEKEKTIESHSIIYLSVWIK